MLHATGNGTTDQSFHRYISNSITCIFHPLSRDAPQRMAAADIFSSSDPLVAISKIFSSSAKLPSNPGA